MTLSIDEYSYLRNAAAKPTKDVDLGKTLVRVLERELGRERADEVLAALDRAVSPVMIDADREIAAEVKKIKARQAKIQSALSITSGIRFATWGSGHYLVTYDGAPIGSIHALTRSSSGGRKSYSDWIPSRGWWFMEPFGEKPCRTRDEASVVVYGWWVQRMNEPIKPNSYVVRIRVPEGADPAVTAPVGTRGTVMSVKADISQRDWYQVSWHGEYPVGQCRVHELEAVRKP